MIRYQYKIVHIPAGFPTSVQDKFQILGYNGYDLVTVQGGCAYFKKTIEIPDSRDEETNKPEENTVPMRPVDEKVWIKQLMQKHYGNRSAVAEEMDMDERTFYRRIKKYGLVGKYIKKNNYSRLK